MLPKTAAAALLSLGLVACAGNDTSLEDVNPRDDTSDRLFDYVFETSPSDFVELAETTYEGVASALESEGENGRVVVVESPLLVLDTRRTGTVAVKVETIGYIDWFLDDLRFLVYYEDKSDANDPWKPFVAEGVANGADGPIPVQTNNFESIEFSAEEDALTVFSSTYPDGLPINRVGLAERNTRLAIFVVPAATWGDITGDYDFKLTATCDGVACAPKGDPEVEPDNPDDPEDKPDDSEERNPDERLPNMPKGPHKDILL
jgi:hypothetical protein